MIGYKYRGGKVVWVSDEEIREIEPYLSYTTHLFDTLLIKTEWKNLYYAIQHGFAVGTGVKISTRAARYNHRYKMAFTRYTIPGGDTGMVILLSEELCAGMTDIYPPQNLDDWQLLDSRQPYRGQTSSGLYHIGNLTAFFTGVLATITNSGRSYQQALSAVPWETEYPGIFPVQITLEPWLEKANRVVAGFVRGKKVTAATVSKLLGVS